MASIRNIIGTLYFKMSLSFIVIIIILVTSVSMTTSYIFLGNYEQELRQKNTLILDQLKENVDQFILEASDKLITYSISTDADVMKLFRLPVEGNEFYIQEAAARITNLINSNPLYHSIFIYYKANELVVSNYGTYYLNQKVDRAREFRWLTEGTKPRGNWNGMKGFKPYPTVNDSLSRDVIAYAKKYPFSENMSLNLGTIAVTIDYDKLFQQMESLSSAVFGEMYVLDAQGNVMYDSTRKHTFQKLAELPLLKQVMEKDQDYTPIEENGEKKLAFQTNSSVNTWKYVNVVPLDLFQQELASVKKTSFAIAVAAILVFIAISMFWAQKLYRPIGQLVQRTKHVMRELLLTDQELRKDDKALDYAFDHLVLKIGELQNKIVIHEPQIKNSVLTKLFEGKYGQEAEVERELEQFRISFPFPHFFCLTIKALETEPSDPVVRDTFYSNLVYYIEHVDAQDCVKLATDAVDGHVLALINSRDYASVVRFVKDLIEYGTQRSGMRLFIGIGEGRSRLVEVSRSYAGASQALQYAFVHPELAIFSEGETSERERMAMPFPGGYSDKFEKALNEGNMEAIQDCLGNMVVLLRRKEYAFQTVQKQLLLLAAIVHRKQKAAGLEQLALLPNDMLSEKFLERNHIHDVFRLLASACRELVEAVQQQRDNRVTAELAQMQAYIQQLVLEGRPEEITLQEVADQFNKNANYLSKLFSEGIGVTFKDYVINLKLMEAEKALHNPNVKIKDVAKDMGYENISYFIRIFKRKYGCTPKEYLHHIHYLKEEAHERI
ncbi:helix-turn-helix domain-containing protein [Paenibacillus sp. HJGM_3]|uniref:helix-turn-helix domain-containing protein n=1 Tax=Paenibacillus sp. HJGM_3 TaxID=3379816 RepID=UPI00385B35E4